MIRCHLQKRKAKKLGFGLSSYNHGHFPVLTILFQSEVFGALAHSFLLETHSSLGHCNIPVYPPSLA